MNKAKLTSLCHNVSRKTGLPFNGVMLYYFLESILKKLANSEYNERIKIKGYYVRYTVCQGIKSLSSLYF